MQKSNDSVFGASCFGRNTSLRKSTFLTWSASPKYNSPCANPLHNGLGEFTLALAAMSGLIMATSVALLDGCSPLIAIS